MSFHIRPATTDDVPAILRLIRALAEYERLSHKVVADEAALERTLFGPDPVAETWIAVEDDAPVGFALFFRNYSTFLAKPGIYLEDLFVIPEARGKGYGKALLERVVSLARERGCGRVEWSVLDWNQLAIDFYRSMGATPMDDWTTMRIEFA